MRRKGVDGFSVETPGLLTDPVPITPSSDSLTDALTAISHVVIRRFIHSRNHGTVGHNVSFPRACQDIDVYAFRLLTLTPPKYGAACETLPSLHLFHAAINL
ncbi:hypothetical protein AVEN_6688-1 [Araneus ventricosus]|uniref:Uncharacterized protein n=1 Tax=Araneus ventricosus TaxID=182803 RepID=A0A4Y2KC62_ARAVE|nr:hypothetical protein AVEN_6688-1 [Araneus ventricosus]